MSPTLCAGLSMGISNIIILLMSVLFLIFFLLKIKKNGYKGMYLSDPEPEVSALKLDEAFDAKNVEEVTLNNNEDTEIIEEDKEE